MTKVVLIAGGNKGDKELLAARYRVLLEERVGKISRLSKIHHTPAWGFESEEEFWNQVVEIESCLSPVELLQKIHLIEAELGRQRDEEAKEKCLKQQRYASRTMDIDILFYGDEIIQSEELQIPHPRIQEREFVLAPLCEILPDLRHPLLGKTVSELMNDLTSDESI